MFAPKVPIFLTKPKETWAYVKKIRIDEKQIQHNGKKRFWAKVDLEINKGSVKKYKIGKIVKKIQKITYFFFNLSFKIYATTPKQRESNLNNTDLLISSPQLISSPL